MKHIKLYFGESESGIWDNAIGIIGVLIIFLIIMAYVNGVLKRFKKLVPADAIRLGTAQEKQKSTKRFKLSHKKLLSTNVFMGIKDVLNRKKLYLTMLLVIMIATFILIVPRNLYHTIASEQFSGYMGIGICDIIMDVQQVEDVEGKAADIAKVLEQDVDIAQYTVLTTKTFETIMPDGTKERIKVELGNHQAFPVFYSEGQAPQSENEMALSGLNASALGKKVGDLLTLVINGKQRSFKVCGIYSDITNGGKSAKATFSAPEAGTMWSVIYIRLHNDELKQAKKVLLETQFAYAKVFSIKERISKTFGGTLSAIQKASAISMAIAILISFLITILFIKMLIVKDKPTIAILKAIGFKCKDINKQYMTRSGCILVVAVILGIILSNTLGEVLAGALLASLGAVSFKLMVAPLETYLLCPILLASAVIGATLIATGEIKQVKISENIKE